MAFTITFDYRFDSSGFFDDPARRAALDSAADQWEAVIRDDFDDLPIGTSFEIRNPTSNAIETVTLSQSVDDMIIFVGATGLSGSTLALAGPDGLDAAGDVYAARISSNFQNDGPVTDFEPWAGTITFNLNSAWHFGAGAPDPSQSDFRTVATHEIGHILGVGTSATFDRWIVNDVFTGPNATALNSGAGVPLETDGGHVEDGFDDDRVLLDPTLVQGTQVPISAFDKAILADIGYDIAGFSKQGSTRAISTSAGERIFGRDVDDTINGLGGDDTIQGGGGNDELRGGAGNDLLSGQGGQDTFVIGSGDRKNTITDFNFENETIRLLNSGFATAAEAAAAVTKTASNVSRLTFSDGTTVDIFHESQPGTPLNASHFSVSTNPNTPPTLPTPSNKLPTGDVTISGTLQVGSVLTAETDTVQDANGLGPFSYTWFRDGAVIPGATGPTYTLSETDLGTQLRVLITFIDGGGRQETVASATTSDILPAPQFVPPADENTDEDTPEDQGDTSTEDPVTDTTDQPDQDTDQDTSANPDNNLPMGVLVILGDARVGETLTARPNGVSDADGIDYDTANFQWLRNGEAIEGATAQTYDVTEADIGTGISLQYSYTDLGGTVEILVTDPKPTVPPGTVEVPGDTGSDGGDDNDGSGNEDPGTPTPPPPEEEDNETDGVNDTFVTATPFNDIFAVRLGMDVIDGGGGVDTAVFTGDLSNYILNISSDGVIVTDRRDDGLGTIRLENIERVGFETGLPSTNGTMDLRQFTGQTDLDDAEFVDFIEMYIAYFNRAPDAVGLAFWSTAYANGSSLEDIARLFVDQDETRDTYPDGTSNIQFASEVYSNVLGRAPDYEGLMFWKDALDSGTVSRDAFILEILRGVDAEPTSDASAVFVEKQRADQDYLSMKTDLGALFAVHRGMSDVSDAADIMALFDGTQDGYAEAVAAIDAAYTDALDAENGEFLMPLVGVLDDSLIG
ncbi:DUF4214 domain-containing protein [Marivita sp. S0852]|uniref:DUF4214 domain-containing protein n=1 Tax=Marivita sp. S0852 TaxID=3373893 RepID=UPI003981DDCA